MYLLVVRSWIFRYMWKVQEEAEDREKLVECKIFIAINLNIQSLYVNNFSFFMPALLTQEIHKLVLDYTRKHHLLYMRTS